MSTLPLTLVIKDYDYLMPLACGDLVAEGLNLTMVRDTPGALDRTLGDPAVPAGELSMSRHVIRMATGDGSWVGLPFFAYRAYRQRCFFVARGSGLHSLEQLRGKRIGSNEWPATGNVWSRALLPDAGVPIESIQWRLGPVDDPGAPGRPQGTLPPHVQAIPEGRCLREMLLAGELDALMVPLPPRGFYEAGSPIVRLIPNYRQVEQEYCRRVGFYPAHHIIGIRRAVYDAHPELAGLLYDALERSRLLWQHQRAAWATATPWYLAELEEAAALLGDDWQANGLAANRPMLQAFCDASFAQGLIPRRMTPEEVFPQFAR